MRVAMAREGRTVLEVGVDLVCGVVRTRIAVMPGGRCRDYRIYTLFIRRSLLLEHDARSLYW